jgi:hypothetical protein
MPDISRWYYPEDGEYAAAIFSFITNFDHICQLGELFLPERNIPGLASAKGRIQSVTNLLRFRHSSYKAQ